LVLVFGLAGSARWRYARFLDYAAERRSDQARHSRLARILQRHNGSFVEAPKGGAMSDETRSFERVRWGDTQPGETT
jgi:hypothetical protein